MHIRDRIKELRRVKASQLERHPENWRTHPPEQRQALGAMLDEIGYAAAVIAYETPEGALQIIDGHLRTDLADDDEIPVLILNVDEQEARQLLVTIDPLAAMAGAEADKLTKLLDLTPLPRAADDLLAALHRTYLAIDATLETAAEDAEPDEVDIPESFQVVAQCRDEAHQKTLFEELTERGLHCKLLTT